jgi:hypothetical protein
MRNAATFRCVLALALLGGTAGAAPFATPVRRSADPSAFIPAGYTVEESVEGDLNGDALVDRVLVLLHDEREEGDRMRALVVLLREKDGWFAAGTNGTLVACFQCLGMKGGDATPDIVIEKRVISITQFGGSRYYYGSTHRFRWSAEARRFKLIGLDSSAGDAILGSFTEESANYLTREIVTTTQPAQVNDAGDTVEAPAVVKRHKMRSAPLESLEASKWEF